MAISQPKFHCSSSYFLLLFFFFFMSLCLCCPEDHKQALLQFKSILIGNHNQSSTISSTLDSWVSNSDCCLWNGVSCSTTLSSRPRPVEGLDLSFLIIESTSAALTPLFHIRSLTNLDIHTNGMYGEIPTNGFINLTRLVSLDLSDNHFKGSIPSQIFGLRNLKFLKLAKNSLSGKIPNEIGNLNQLESLDVSNNQLHGKIPNEIGNLNQLRSFNVRSNEFFGGIPTSFGNLSQLVSLILDNNKLSGEIPVELFEIERLEELSLRGNKLNSSTGNSKINPKFSLKRLNLGSCGIIGNFPNWLSNQKDLFSLDLTDNELEGTIPQWLDLNIVEISLQNNKLTGSLPPHIFQPNLQFLDLSKNNFIGELPNNIGDSINLAILWLGQNNFSGSLPLSMETIYPLIFLDLSDNNFSGDKIPKFHNLSYVDLSSNKFSGEVPVDFGTSVSTLKLGQNKFSGRLPENLTTMQNLEYLDLHNNEISGEVPNFLSQISRLKILILRENNLHGSIPHLLANLTDLQILDLSGNNLNGEIPQMFGNITGMIGPRGPIGLLESVGFSLSAPSSMLGNGMSMMWKGMIQSISSKTLDMYRLMDLSSNQLSGKIPSSLGSLKGLKSLNISNNKLSGNIPTSFGGFENLESLDLSHNKLYGVIPQTFKNLKQLTKLDVSNNELEGEIPEGNQMDTMNNLNSYANNKGLCGKQIQVPCHTLSPPSYITKVEEEPWFLWEGVWVGFPLGFFWAIFLFHLIKYFTQNPQKLRLVNQCF